MDYGFLYRSLAFLLVFALCVAFSFGLASSVLAASDYTHSVRIGNHLYVYNAETGVLLTDENPYSSENIILEAGIVYKVAMMSTAYPTLLFKNRVNTTVLRGYAGTSKLEPHVFSVDEFDSITSLVVNSNSASYVEFYFVVNASSVSVDSVILSASTSSPYYPGNEVQLNAEVSGTGIEPGTPESTVYWYVHGNTSADTYIDNDGLLTIANDETALSLEVEAISTYDSTKSATISVPVSYPLNLQITPSQTTLITSTKRQEVQFKLLLPNGQPFDYTLVEWSTPGADGQYFRIDDNGFLEILPGAPAGSVTVKYAYQHDTGNVSTTSATVTIIMQQEGIYDQLTPTPEQSDKADQMEDAIGDAADKLENNNSSLGQLTPTRPQINTNLEFDKDQMLAVSPLVTNIWSINGLGRMISIVLVVATVAYIFFGKRDG